MNEKTSRLGWIDKFLAVWIGVCIIIGLGLGKYLPELSKYLQVGIPVMLTIVWMALRRRNHPQAITVETKSAQKVGKGGVC